MALRWAGAAALETERSFRKIIGHEDLSMLKVVLEDDQADAKRAISTLDEERLAA